MPSEEDQQQTQHEGYTLETRTTCRLDGVDDTWNTDEFDGGEEIAEAIETVREDHSERVIVEGESIWMFAVYWNDNTGSVWVGRYGYNGGMEVEDDE